jgi:hypothetical protein
MSTLRSLNSNCSGSNKILCGKEAKQVIQMARIRTVSLLHRGKTIEATTTRTRNEKQTIKIVTKKKVCTPTTAAVMHLPSCPSPDKAGASDKEEFNRRVKLDFEIVCQ